MAISISYCISMIAKNHLEVNMKRRNQNQKFSFPFFAGSPHTPRRKRNCKEKFWVLVHATGGSVRGAHCSLHHEIGAYDSVSSHHALRACEVRGFVGNGFGLFDIMTTKFDLTKKQNLARLRRAHGRAFPQGNATAFRIPPPAFPPLCGGSPNSIWDAGKARVSRCLMRLQIVGVSAMPLSI